MRWLLRLLLSETDRRAVESDLAELYELRRREHGDRAAARWLRRQHLVYPLHVLADRVRAAAGDALGVIPSLWRDALYSARSLSRTPTVAATIIITVGLGLGATTAMIGVIRAVLIKPLPYTDAENLYWIYTDNPPYRFRFSVVDYRALEADHPTFSGVAAYQTSSVTISDGGRAERVTAKAVTGSYFPLLGQTPLIGRLLDASDDTRNDRVAVLTAAYWASHFASDPGVLGRAITVDGTSYTIVGVLQTSRRASRARTSRSLQRPVGHRRSERGRSSRWPSDVSLLAPRSRLRSTRCGRRTGACFRSGSRPTRTKRQRGVSSI